MSRLDPSALPHALRFEDLVCWQKARLLNREIYRITRRSDFRHDRELARQMRASSVSVMANIAEGYDRRGFGELKHHLSIATGSCSELRSHLYVVEDENYSPAEDVTAVRLLAEEVSRLVIGFQNSLKRK